MTLKKGFSVPFHGGPLDGERTFLFQQAESCKPDWAIPLNEAAMWLSIGERLPPKQTSEHNEPVRKFAIYCLEISGTEPVYRFNRYESAC